MASLKPFSPNLEALYEDPPAKGFFPAKLLMLMIVPPRCRSKL
jgi:hypothetical protein